MTAVMWLWVCILIREEIGKLPGKWATCLEAISKLYPHYMCIKLYPQNILHPYTCHYTTILLYHHQNFCRQKKTKTYLVDTFFRLKSRVFFPWFPFFFHGFHPPFWKNGWVPHPRRCAAEEPSLPPRSPNCTAPDPTGRRHRFWVHGMGMGHLAKIHILKLGFHSTYLTI